MMEAGVLTREYRLPSDVLPFLTRTSAFAFVVLRLSVDGCCRTPPTIIVTIRNTGFAEIGHSKTVFINRGCYVSIHHAWRCIWREWLGVADQRSPKKSDSPAAVILVPSAEVATVVVDKASAVSPRAFPDHEMFLVRAGWTKMDHGYIQPRR